MAERWAKIYAKSGENPDIGELLETEPITVSLWFLSIARADVYGILPADPRRFRAVVAPAAAIPSATVAQSLQSMEKMGWIRTYTSSDGELLLHITKYHELQDVRWANRIGPPEHELPPWWEAPDGFLAVLEGIDLAKVRSKKNREVWVALRKCYCSATVVRRENITTQTQTQTQTQNNNDVTPSLPAAVATVGEGENEGLEDRAESPPEITPEVLTAPPPPVAPKQTQPKRLEEDIIAEVNSLREDLTPGFREAIDTFLLMACERRHARAMAPTVRLQYTKDLVKIATEEGMTEEAFAHGVSAAVNAGADKANYVKTAARNAVTSNKQRPLNLAAGSDRGNGSAGMSRGEDPLAFLSAHNPNGRRFIQLKDGRREYERDWMVGTGHKVAEEIAAENWDADMGCTKSPTDGLCCVDGMYYEPRKDPTPWRQMSSNAE